ncbi:hypothetical protein [Pseudomonas palmensis]
MYAAIEQGECHEELESTGRTGPGGGGATEREPVYAGDAITCHWLIVDKDERGHARAQLSIVNAQGETVLEGMTTGVLPNAAARERMAQLLAEGDPGNLAAAGA